MALSLLQGGTGFPFLAPCIYDFICGLPIASLQPSIDHIPDPEVGDIALKVHILLARKIAVLTC